MDFGCRRNGASAESGWGHGGPTRRRESTMNVAERGYRVESQTEQRLSCASWSQTSDPSLQS
ncbi:hypothetical protein DP107_07920 [Haloglomus irregulare]|uniref:Uncharacterized protein n=1 Tax=Haloglomus irregulare TaxID=2234134 RepID=A0A554NBW3_9EURY|nr:hypothetical protein DP107_07920 [Haloglomus irregulare]